MIEDLIERYKVSIQAETNDSKRTQYILEIETAPKIYGLLCLRIVKNKMYYYTYNLENAEQYIEVLKCSGMKIKKLKDFDCEKTSPLENLLKFLKIENTRFTTLKLSSKAIKTYGIEIC